MFSFSCIAVSGAEAFSFLQGQLTADLRLINATQSLLAAHAARDGRVESLFLVIGQEDTFHLWVPTPLKENAVALLKKYAVFSKVTFTETNDRFLSLIEKPKDFRGSFESSTLFSTCRIEDEIYIQAPHHPALLIVESYQPYINEYALTHWIETEIPWILPETQHLFFVHDLNLPQLNAVSFKKGCYLGQEIIARMEFRGKLKRKLQKISLPVGPFRLGHSLQQDDQDFGKVVLAVTDHQRLIALVVTTVH